MKFLKKIFKSKKGSEAIETMMMLPFVMYAVLYAGFRTFNYIDGASTEGSAQTYVRQMTLQPTFETSMNKLAQMVYINDLSYEYITKIDVTVPENGLYTTKTFTFNTPEDAGITCEFTDVVRNTGGNITFDELTYKTRNLSKEEDYNYVKEKWAKNVLLEITVERDLTRSLPTSLTGFYFTDPRTGDKYYSTFGLDMYSTSTSTGVVKNDLLSDNVED